MSSLPAELITLLRRARSIAVLTGAGMSAESGIPTFRDALTGLWARRDPAQLASREGFEANPRLVWDWYAERRARVSTSLPNPGHLALAAMQAHVDRLVVITQNVDGLHQQAGSRDVIELHGNIRRVKCLDCNRVAAEWADDGARVPQCVHCNGLLRPDVVWFGEVLPPAAFGRAVDEAKACDVFMSIGTSGVVQPAASLPLVAARSGKPVITINLDAATRVHAPHIDVGGKSGAVLPALLQAAWP